MKVAIMQPYFLPYIGYFSLIKNTDKFILLDEVQFIRHGWIERNRVQNYNKEWQYIKVPLVKHSQKTTIKKTQINNSTDWARKIFAQLEAYKKKSPYYDEVIILLKPILEKKFESIVHLNSALLTRICDYLKIKTEVTIFSEMDLEIDEVNSADEWALNICKALPSVKEYWNPEGGETFFNKEKYIENGIDIKFLKQKLTPYKQRRQEFIPGLSIIDVLMFNDTEETNQLIDQYSFV